MKKKINKVSKKKVKKNTSYWNRYNNRNANIVDNGRGKVIVY